jgi:hypothetical protein
VQSKLAGEPLGELLKQTAAVDAERDPVLPRHRASDRQPACAAHRTVTAMRKFRKCYDSPAAA